LTSDLNGTEEMFSVTVNMKFDSISHGRFQWIVHAQEGGDLDSVYEEGDVTKVPCNDDAWPHL